MKRSKKIYDEEKSVRKKKSKSSKRRRKESSSPSSYSSDPEDDPRAHRRLKKGSTKPVKQRNELKKSGRKKSRKSSRYRRRVSASPSSGRSSSGGSTDGRRRQRRSRGPVARPDRKGKSRASTESRGRSRRRMNDEREGSRFRCPSSSTCRSRSVSSSSRGRSPVRSLKRTEEREMKIEKSNRFLSEEMVLINNSDKDDEKDNNTQACGNSTNSRSKDDAYEVKRKLDVHPRASQIKNTQRVVRKEERGHAEEGELVLGKLDSQSSEKANAGEEYSTMKNENPTNSVKSVADLELILRQKALENFRKFRRGASTNKAAIAAAGNEASETKDDSSEVVELQQKALQNLRNCQDGCSTNIRTNIDMENEATETHDDPPEVKEMRQKALENFRKSQGGISVNSRPAVNREKESIQTLPYDKLLGSIEDQNSGNIVRHRLTNSHVQEVRIDSDTRQSGRRMRSVVTIPEKGTSEQNTDSQISTDISEVANMCLPDNLNASQVIRSPVVIDKPSTEGSSMKTSVDEDKHHKRIDTEFGSHATNITNINEADLQLVSEVSAPESKTRHEIKEENAGSQFQEKKFSRMHDGELVQVSYKVYIPNRAPALARRKLQR